MDVYKTSLDEFSCGHDEATAESQQVVASGYGRQAYNGVTIRADTSNTGTIYIGPNAGVSADNGLQLPAGEEVVVPIDNPEKVWLIGVGGSTFYNWISA